MKSLAALRTKKLYSEIGKRIRELRTNKGYSLDELSKKTGFAKSYLSQIENLKREPSISALSQIAYVLGVDLLFLLTGEEQEADAKKFTLVKKEERKAVHRPPGSLSYTYESVTYKKRDRLVEGFVVTMGSEFPLEPFVHEGQEFVYVLEGKQEFIYDGKTYLMEEGDCYYFDSDRPHYSRSINDRPCKVLVVFIAKK